MAAANDGLQISINGEPRTVARGSTIQDLVVALGLQSRPVAVECNKRLVRRADHAATMLADGDRLEVVTFFGGG